MRSYYMGFIYRVIKGVQYIDSLLWDHYIRQGTKLIKGIK